MSKAKLFIKLLVAALLIGGAVFGVLYLKANKPEIGRAPRPKIAYLVDTVAVKKAADSVVVRAMGTVVPVHQVALKARVSGQVTELAGGFMPGGYITANELMVKIDSSDYLLTLAQAQGQLANAQAALALEQGRQEVARREWELVNGQRQYTEQEKALALRQPQLKQAQAAVAIATSNVGNAQLDLDRTEIRAPFNCIVLSKNIDLGSNISTQETLATLVDVDLFWIETSVPQDELKWLEVPGHNSQSGSDARIIYNNGQVVTGKVVSLLTSLEAKGRMARVLIEVKDPLGLRDSERGSLLLGDYVRVDIQGKKQENIVRIPRTAWREGDNVWLAVKDGEGYKLEIRPADALWRNENTVMVSTGLEDGELLITTAIASPVNGMNLRVSEPTAKKE